MDFLLIIISCLLCLLTTFAVLLRFLSTQTPANLPPGPSRLPIIGNLHNLGDKPHKSLAHLASIHGPLMTLKLGQVTTIVASSPSVAKEILQKHDLVLSDRQLILAIRAHDHHEHGLPWVPVGPKWRNLRKVCNTYLFTTQKLDSNQELRRKKIQELLEAVRRNACENKAVDIGKAAFMTTFGALSTTVLSLDLTDEASEDAREFKEVARCIMDEAGKPNLGDYFPVLGKLDLQGIHRRMSTYFGKVLNLFGRIIEERLKKRNSEAYVSGNDMLDTLLDIVDQENRDASMDLDLIKHLFLDLFVAGTDTTSSTLEWAIVELLRNPKTFTKAREELNLTIGKGGRRICPGLPLAMRMLHMMLGSLIHSFDWKLEDGESLDMEEKFGITLQKAKPLVAFPTPI
ncbi:Geraniol 8-hydroxylase [Linum perenne]